MPADIAAHVQAIIGLSNLATPHPVTAADPVAVGVGAIAVVVLGTAAGAALLGLFGGLLLGASLSFIVAGLLILYAVSLDGPIMMMSEMSQAKAAAGVEWATATGAGQRIGLLQFDTLRMSDVADWASLVGLPASTLSRLSQVAVNGGVSAPRTQPGRGPAGHRRGPAAGARRRRRRLQRAVHRRENQLPDAVQPDDQRRRHDHKQQLDLLRGPDQPGRRPEHRRHPRRRRRGGDQRAQRDRGHRQHVPRRGPKHRRRPRRLPPRHGRRRHIAGRWARARPMRRRRGGTGRTRFLSPGREGSGQPVLLAARLPGQLLECVRPFCPRRVDQRRPGGRHAAVSGLRRRLPTGLRYGGTSLAAPTGRPSSPA